MNGFNYLFKFRVFVTWWKVEFGFGVLGTSWFAGFCLSMLCRFPRRLPNYAGM